MYGDSIYRYTGLGCLLAVGAVFGTLLRAEGGVSEGDVSPWVRCWVGDAVEGGAVDKGEPTLFGLPVLPPLTKQIPRLMRPLTERDSKSEEAFIIINILC